MHNRSALKITDTAGREYRVEQPDPTSKIATETSLGQEWFASDSAYNVVSVLESTPDSLPQAFLMSLAVAGGNLYRLFLGPQQPEMRLAQDANGKYWRLSKRVPGYTDWAAAIEEFDDGTRFDVLNEELIPGTNCVHDGERVYPIIGINSILVVSLFLNDIDMNPGNIGLKRLNNFLLAIKVDPECCFHINLLDDRATLRRKLLNILLSDNHSNELWENLKDPFIDNEEAALALLQADTAKLELLTTVNVIANTPWENIKGILEQCIITTNAASDALKTRLITTLQQRHQHFRYFAATLTHDDFKNLSVEELNQGYRNPVMMTPPPTGGFFTDTGGARRAYSGNQASASSINSEPVKRAKRPV